MALLRWFLSPENLSESLPTRNSNHLQSVRLGSEIQKAKILKIHVEKKSDKLKNSTQNQGAFVNKYGVSEKPQRCL
jgi:hypothetical protein